MAKKSKRNGDLNIVTNGTAPTTINIFMNVDNYNNYSDLSTDNSQSQTQVNAVVTNDQDEALKGALMPMFKGDGEAVERFVAAVRAAKSSMIPKIVNDNIKNGVIVGETTQRSLWKILHDMGYYLPTYQTWNSQIK